MVNSRGCSGWFCVFLLAASPATVMGLAGCGTYPPAWVTASNDEGGLLGKYVEKYRVMAARGDTLVVDGPCNSACTLALGIVVIISSKRVGCSTGKSDGRNPFLPAFGPATPAMTTRRPTAPAVDLLHGEITMEGGHKSLGRPELF
jgi:hypothetical protein